MLETAVNAPRLGPATWGVRLQFFLSGALFATWGVHVPTVKAHYGLGEQALGLAMLSSGVGALFALSRAGRLIGRVGARPVALWSGMSAAACLALLLAFGHYAALLLLMFGYGVSASLFDVAFNAEASEIERLARRPLMSGFHGMFSLGGMAGAAMGSALQGVGVDPVVHLVGAAVLGAAALAWSTSVMLPTRAASDSTVSVPHGVLALMGVLAALGLIGEGAMYDWSVLYLRQSMKADASTAALAYASFSGAMAAARFAGDAVRTRLSPLVLMRASGALAAAGLALALLAPVPAVALAGFALVGLGFANVVPLLFSAASRLPGVSPAQGIAAVSSAGYLGMMAGPPVVGFIAQQRSLAEGLAVVALFALALAFTPRRAMA